MDNSIEMNEIISNSIASASTTLSDPQSFDPQKSFKTLLNNTDDIKFIDGTPILLPKKSTKKLKKQSVKYSNTEKQQQQQKQSEQYDCNWRNDNLEQKQSSNNYKVNKDYEIINSNNNEHQYKTNNNIECENNVKSNEKEHQTKSIFSRNSSKSIKKSPSVRKAHLTISETETENGNNDNYDYFLDKSINNNCLDNFRDSLINISIASSIRGKNEFQIPTNPPIKVTIEKSNSNTSICQDSLAPFLNSYNHVQGTRLRNYIHLKK